MAGGDVNFSLQLGMPGQSTQAGGAVPAAPPGPDRWDQPYVGGGQPQMQGLLPTQLQQEIPHGVQGYYPRQMTYFPSGIPVEHSGPFPHPIQGAAALPADSSEAEVERMAAKKRQLEGKGRRAEDWEGEGEGSASDEVKNEKDAAEQQGQVEKDQPKGQGISAEAGFDELENNKSRKEEARPNAAHSGRVGSSGQGELDHASARKVHKADREKLRRDRLNEQFSELAGVLDPERPKNDKATILGDSVHMVHELRSSVKRLKMENTALLDESRELAQEKMELRQEKAALKTESEAMQTALQERLRALLPWMEMMPSSMFPQAALGAPPSTADVPPAPAASVAAVPAPSAPSPPNPHQFSPLSIAQPTAIAPSPSSTPHHLPASRSAHHADGAERPDSQGGASVAPPAQPQSKQAQQPHHPEQKYAPQGSPADAAYKAPDPSPGPAQAQYQYHYAQPHGGGSFPAPVQPPQGAALPIHPSYSPYQQPMMGMPPPTHPAAPHQRHAVESPQPHAQGLYQQPNPPPPPYAPQGHLMLPLPGFYVPGPGPSRAVMPPQDTSAGMPMYAAYPHLLAPHAQGYPASDQRGHQVPLVYSSPHGYCMPGHSQVQMAPLQGPAPPDIATSQAVQTTLQLHTQPQLQSPVPRWMFPAPPHTPQDGAPRMPDSGSSTGA